MSLMDRVRAAGQDLADARVSGAPQELRERVGAILPPQRLAHLAADSPKQAEGEIRGAVEQVLQDAPWLAGDGQGADSIAQSLVDEVFGLGPLEQYLEDDSVTEIMVNGCRSLFVERDGACVACPVPFSDDEAVRTLIDRILGPLGRRVDESSPMVDARLSSGHRVNAVIPPIAPDGPVLTIRKFARKVLSLDDLRQRGTLDARMADLLAWAVVARKNIAVSGGTGTGKTTLLNALSCAIPHGERVLTIEDSAELRFLEHPHVVRMEARPVNAEGKGEVGIRHLVKNALRMRPDRIVVGEVRGEEALDMLNAMNTGHDGSLTTLHSNSPADAIMRLTTMVRFAAELPLDAIEAQIGTALDMVVQLTRYRDGRRRVSQICEVRFDRRERACQVEPLYTREGMGGEGVWHAAPAWLGDLRHSLDAGAEEVDAWLQATRLSSSAA